MDQRHTLFLAFSIGADLVAQAPFEFADQRTHQVSYAACARAGDTWIVGGNAGHEDGVSVEHFVAGFDGLGQLVWETPFLGPTYTGIVMDMTPVPGSGVLVTGPHDGCDVMLTTSMVSLIDPAGNVIWSRDLWLEFASRVDRASDGRILVSGSQAVKLLDQFGDSLATIELDSLGFPSANWCVWDSDSSMMLVRYNDQLERRSLGAAVLAVASFDNIQDVVRWQGHRLVLGNDGIVLDLDDDLSELGPVDLGAAYDRGRFVPADSTIWVIGNVEAAELDDDLAILRTVVLDPDGTFGDQVFQDYAVAGDAIAMVGNPTTVQRPAGMIRTVVADGTVPQHDEDVSITVVSVDSVWYSLSGTVIYPRANVTVRVTNEGSGLLDEVVLNHWQPYGFCSSVGTTLHLAALGLATGQFEDVSMTDLWLSFGPWGWLSLDQQVCIGALSPNALYDRDPSDNLGCDTAHIVLGVEEPALEAPFVLVQDASGDALELRFFAPTTSDLRLTLLDATGRVHLNAFIPKGVQGHRISTISLRSGLHVAQVCDAGRGRWAVKWVKE